MRRSAKAERLSQNAAETARLRFTIGRCLTMSRMMKEFIVDGFLRGEAIKGTETMRRLHDVRLLLLFIAAFA
ncbi:MAG TPA: hypothetical protein DCG12_12275, partial [Planctomycetaceae bacterium]|nr:hypothetical protein [Planctomycetaceae bacterium]